MQFNSVEFMIFFPVVLAVYFVIPGKARKIWLLLASYWFYMSWNAVYAALIGGSTIVTYGCALWMEKLAKQEDAEGAKKKKKAVLILCLLINLGILALFKYGNLGIETLNSLLGLVHLRPLEHRFSFLLPVGISFYTFQALGYSIDVYRGDVEAEHDFLRYALFVSFFPQLVAGPIERSKNLLAQMHRLDRIPVWNLERISDGAVLMVWGFFMKMVIADRAAIFVDTVFDSYRMAGSTELILAAVLFTIQIYCDFGSYSMIAIGAAKIMGFDLMENFNTPFLARNIRDFWTRWHISLSTWFRDYLYIPLGGNRKGKFRRELNILIVFLVSGLWHGASWNFVLWGGTHGLYQVAADLTNPFRKRMQKKLGIRTDCFSWHLLETLGTFALTVIAFVFFRTKTIPDAFRFFKRSIFRQNPWILFNGGLYELGLDRVQMKILVVSLLILFLVDFVRFSKGVTLEKFLKTQNLWFSWLVLIGLVWMILVFGAYGPGFNAQQFIYFAF